MGARRLTGYLGGPVVGMIPPIYPLLHYCLFLGNPMPLWVGLRWFGSRSRCVNWFHHGSHPPPTLQRLAQHTQCCLPLLSAASETLRMRCTPLSETAPSSAVALLSRGLINVDQGDPHGTTPLMMSVIRGNAHVARVLLSRGADVSLIKSPGECHCSALLHQIRKPGRD